MIFRLALLTLVVLLASCSQKKEKLYLFTWSEIFKPELIKEFEKKYDCDVVLAFYDSNESMYAKLKLGAAGYDLIFPSSYFMDILEQQKMIQPLDPEKIPHLAHMDPRFFKPSNPIWGIPFLVGYSGLAFRKDRLHEIEPTWNVFARKDLKGRMTMLNDMRDALGAALKFLGYSINSTNPEEIETAANQLIRWKKNLAKFEGEQYKSGIANAEFLIVQAHTIDIAQVRRENENVVFVFPKEGVIMAIDYMAIPKDAKNPALANAFINFMLDPEVAARNMEYIHALVPVLPAYKLLDPELQKDPMLFPLDEDCEKMEVIKDLKNATKYYFRAWDRVKVS